MCILKLYVSVRLEPVVQIILFCIYLYLYLALKDEIPSNDPFSKRGTKRFASCVNTSSILNTALT